MISCKGHIGLYKGYKAGLGFSCIFQVLLSTTWSEFEKPFQQGLIIECRARSKGLQWLSNRPYCHARRNRREGHFKDIPARMRYPSIPGHKPHNTYLYNPLCDPL